MLIEYKDKTAVITGASSGIGEAFARELHRRGMQVVLVARREERLRKICEELCLIRSESARIFVRDLSKDSDIARLMEFLKEERVDFLLNNAGFGSFGRYEKLDLQHEQMMMRVNAEAPLMLTHAVIPQMKNRKCGYIVNLSSIAAFQPLPFMATYAATKSVNLSHALALRSELRESGVRVLAVCPGPVQTEFGGVARVPGKVTAGPRTSVETVVRDSLRALEKGRAFVVPGFRAKILSLPCRFLPRVFTTFIAEKALRSVLPWAESEKSDKDTSYES